MTPEHMTPLFSTRKALAEKHGFSLSPQVNALIFDAVDWAQRAQPATMFNGLTEAETDATASVFGLVGAQPASAQAVHSPAEAHGNERAAFEAWLQQKQFQDCPFKDDPERVARWGAHFELYRWQGWEARAALEAKAQPKAAEGDEQAGWHFARLQPSGTVSATAPDGRLFVVPRGRMDSEAGDALLNAMTADLTKPNVQPKAAEGDEPLFLLHCGQIDSSGEQDDWDTEAYSGKRVEEFCRQHPGQTVKLYPHVQPKGTERILNLGAHMLFSRRKALAERYGFEMTEQFNALVFSVIEWAEKTLAAPPPAPAPDVARALMLADVLAAGERGETTMVEAGNMLRALALAKGAGLNLADPAVQRRLAAQWGYVQAPAHAPAPEPMAWVPYLSDRADGVEGHYAIARWNPAGYREVWNLRSHRWASASDDVLCLEEADSLLRQIVIPTVKPAPVPQTFTEGHCAEKRKPGGCQLHNLHCGYPACDRKPVAQAPAVEERPLTGCAAGRDGDCTHSQCPQTRDNEPHASGRHCPLDKGELS